MSIEMQWKMWVARYPDGIWLVWDRLSEVEKFGPYPTEQAAHKAMDRFFAELTKQNVKHNELTADDLPEWAKVQ